MAILQKLNEILAKRKVDQKEIFLILHKKKLQEITHRQLAYIWFNTPINVDKVEQFLSELQDNGIPDMVLNEDADLDETTQIDEKSILSLNLQKDLHMNILKILVKFRLPKVRGFKFINVPRQCLDLKELMGSSIFHKPVCFYFAHPTSYSCAEYINVLREVLSKCSIEICLSHVRFTQPEFCSFVKSVKGVKSIELRMCTVHSYSNCDYGEMNGCKIEFITMYQSSTEDLSYWRSTLGRLYHIFAGIDKCKNMKNSLIEISLLEDFYKGKNEVEANIRKRFKNIDHIKLRFK